MIISCLYPKKIYIEDEITKEQIQSIFGKNMEINVGEWFECPKIINNNTQQTINDMIEMEKIDNIYTEEYKTKNNQYDCEIFNSNNNKKITYIVKPLDTYKSVSKKLNISIETLKQIAKTKNLFIGQRIDIQKG